MSKNRKRNSAVSRAIIFLSLLVFLILVTAGQLNKPTSLPVDIDLTGPIPGLFATSGQAIQRRIPLDAGEVNRSGRVFHRR